MGPHQIDLELYFKGDRFFRESLAENLFRGLRDHSAVIVCDSRVSSDENSAFLNMMERYFSQTAKSKLADVHQDVGFQIGLTPEFQEPADPRAFAHFINSGISSHNWPIFCGPDHRDPKERFMWRIGNRPQITAYPELNLAPAIPLQFQDMWADRMNLRGNQMHQTILVIAHLLGIAFVVRKLLRAVDEYFFVDQLTYGPHLLAPNGMNLEGLELGTVINCCHTDFNWGTIHGRGRFRAAKLWSKNGEPFISDLSLVQTDNPGSVHLFQVGEQLEHQTGGLFRAGWHEVAVFPETLIDLERAQRDGRSTIRCSSTMFATVAHDNVLSVIPGLEGKFPSGYFPLVKKIYPDILCGDQVQRSLKRINLL